jgi:hypothetical protein
LRRCPRVPLARERIEELADFPSQVGGPPAGFESGCAARGDAHRMIRAAGA